MAKIGEIYKGVWRNFDFVDPATLQTTVTEEGCIYPVLHFSYSSERKRVGSSPSYQAVGAKYGDRRTEARWIEARGTEARGTEARGD